LIFGQSCCKHKGTGGKHDLQKSHQSIHQQYSLHGTKPYGKRYLLNTTKHTHEIYRNTYIRHKLALLENKKEGHTGLANTGKQLYMMPSK
jgi:hypothetical protein